MGVIARPNIGISDWTIEYGGTVPRAAPQNDTQGPYFVDFRGSITFSPANREEDRELLRLWADLAPNPSPIADANASVTSLPIAGRNVGILDIQRRMDIEFMDGLLATRDELPPNLRLSLLGSTPTGGQAWGVPMSLRESFWNTPVAGDLYGPRRRTTVGGTHRIGIWTEGANVTPAFRLRAGTVLFFFIEYGPSYRLFETAQNRSHDGNRVFMTVLLDDLVWPGGATAWPGFGLSPRAGTARNQSRVRGMFDYFGLTEDRAMGGLHWYPTPLGNTWPATQYRDVRGSLDIFWPSYPAIAGPGGRLFATIPTMTVEKIEGALIERASLYSPTIITGPNIIREVTIQWRTPVF